MIPELLVKETFQDLVDKYDIKIDMISKMKFNLWTLNDLPHSIKEDIKLRLQTITNCIGRKRFELDHPRIVEKSDGLKIIGGIWYVRIF